MASSTPLGPYRYPAASSQQLVPAPRRARRIAHLVALSLGVFLVAALAAPWRQNVSGTGRVMAYAPLERSQPIDAPVGGRVVEWFVHEGSTVEAGDPIVRLSDNDPLLMDRLSAEREAMQARLESYEGRVAAQEGRLAATGRAETSGIASYAARLRAARRHVEAADQAEDAALAAHRTALLNQARLATLHEQGLASRREQELADLTAVRAQTTVDAARARARAARDETASAEANLDRAESTREVELESARASLGSAESDVAATRAAIARLDVRISRQEAQVVQAPRAGAILRLVVNQGGEQVSAGDTLAILVPDTNDRAVELWVDGNDASLISPGRSVRLQFEGWPAVQFAGWPSVAVGTFGGKVAFVDSTDDGNGDFRVVIVPDDEDEAWPSARFLRQGVRANGWMLLEEVSVGFELWRQLNGFPPKLDTPPGTESPNAGRSR